MEKKIMENIKNPGRTTYMTSSQKGSSCCRSSHQKFYVEKSFVEVVGLYDWETFVDMKKHEHLYSRVREWDDSACKEAFHNAKARFRGLMTSFHRKNKRFPNREEIVYLLRDIISWSDDKPEDKYIDEIDWDSEVDSELLNDFGDRVSQVGDDEELPNDVDEDYSASVADTTVKSSEQVVIIFGKEFYKVHGFSIGWGDDFNDLEQEQCLGKNGGEQKDFSNINSGAGIHPQSRRARVRGTCKDGHNKSSKGRPAWK
ncbi:OLC1v1001578C1 [Oldenlandia corymbosa var. corymbosa]|uniref:OLC1v1001578C1 n=1 Tax=Oldenlandia corymbosa var. corymbosa TaxID=529605 RepID=A0AAV1D5H8_OLDCO|nr:OLC1v1001578C1 [Oldenlandia corymbosa var. corymbosa]